jgi:hypothetical protein
MARAKRATEVPTDPLDAMLARLQLSGIRDQLDSLLDEAARANLSTRETLILLCEREIARKDHRRIEMGLKLAHFPAVKELAGFDFEAQPSIDPKQIRDLAALRFVGEQYAVRLDVAAVLGVLGLEEGLARDDVVGGERADDRRVRRDDRDQEAGGDDGDDRDLPLHDAGTSCRTTALIVKTTSPSKSV